MKRSIIIAIATTLTLASCQTDDILDNSGSSQNANNTAIRFDGEAGKMSRAKEKATAAEELNNQFVVFGYKTNSDNTKNIVYNHYNVAWDNKAGTTLSNTAGWEYVGIAKNTLNSGDAQTIKYWDYDASQYDFIAFSFGKATQGAGDDQVQASALTTDNPTYTLTGKVSQLQKCYIADRVTAKKDATAEAYKLYPYNSCIAFSFRSLTTKVKIGIYELIPGYSVKEVKFYSNGTESSPSATVPTLFATSNTIPQAGDQKSTVKITFSTAEAEYNQAKVELGDNTTKTSTLSLSDLKLTGKETSEKTEGNVYLGRSQATASMTEYQAILPTTGVGPLTLKVDFTLESIDGTGEDIKVTGANATIAENYTNWKPNYAYTYYFKITEKTNGTTGGQALHPITFDAVVADEVTTGTDGTIEADTDIKNKTNE